MKWKTNSFFLFVYFRLQYLSTLPSFSCLFRHYFQSKNRLAEIVHSDRYWYIVILARVRNCICNGVCVFTEECGCICDLLFVAFYVNGSTFIFLIVLYSFPFWCTITNFVLCLTMLTHNTRILYKLTINLVQSINIYRNHLDKVVLYIHIYQAGLLWI